MRAPSLVPDIRRPDLVPSGVRRFAQLAIKPADYLPTLPPALTCVGCFFAGALLGNAVPHVVQGTSGNRFQTPFASPPAIGESAPATNVLWGYFNLLCGLAALHASEPKNEAQKLGAHLAVLAGAVSVALWLSSHFSGVRRFGPHP